MKSRVGTERVAFQAYRGWSGWEEDGGAGQVRVWFQVLRVVTVPGGRGVPAGWDGGAAEAGTIGMRNRKFGSNRRGIRAGAARFRVALAAFVRALSYFSLQ
jgi:hypothetical protein